MSNLITKWFLRERSEVYSNAAIKFRRPKLFFDFLSHIWDGLKNTGRSQLISKTIFTFWSSFFIQRLPKSWTTLTSFGCRNFLTKTTWKPLLSVNANCAYQLWQAIYSHLLVQWICFMYQNSAKVFIDHAQNTKFLAAKNFSPTRIRGHFIEVILYVLSTVAL